MPKHIPESAWLEHGPFAFWLIEAAKPRCLVELGTHNGYSYFAFCQAVKQLGLETKCHAIDSWQGDEHAGFYGEEVFQLVSGINAQDYASFSRLTRSFFQEALQQFEDGSIDLLHIDGRHTYEDVLEDYSSWRPKLSERGVVLFHDTRVRERGFGVFRLWAEIAEAHPSFEFHHGHGLGVLAVGPEIPPGLRPLFSSDPAEREAIRAAYERLGAAVSQHYQLATAARDQALEDHSAELETVREQLSEHSVALSGARQALAAGQQEQEELGRRLREAEERADNAEASLQAAGAQLGTLQQHSETLQEHARALRRTAEVLRAELLEQTRLSEQQNNMIALLTGQEQAARETLRQLQQSTLWRSMGPVRRGLALIPEPVRRRMRGRSGTIQPALPAPPGHFPAAAAPPTASLPDAGEMPALPSPDHNRDKGAQEVAAVSSSRPEPLPWPPRRISTNGSDMTRRLCIFSFYDPHGVVDDYVVYLLEK
ncbi:class I SAM-dependent methyltransferase, partial [Teichococcus oryzae]|uniref:class I SAM-dependent methyltransferase n=1 Tax=Teichococcus oryzae TaxID=1608942 RepID=UPI0019D4F115